MRSALLAVSFVLFIALVLWLAMRFIAPEPSQSCDYVGSTASCSAPGPLKDSPKQKSA